MSNNFNERIINEISKNGKGGEKLWFSVKYNHITFRSQAVFLCSIMLKGFIVKQIILNLQLHF